MVKIRTYEGWGVLLMAVLLLASFTAQLAALERTAPPPAFTTVLPTVSITVGR